MLRAIKKVSLSVVVASLGVGLLTPAPTEKPIEAMENSVIEQEVEVSTEEFDKAVLDINNRLTVLEQQLDEAKVRYEAQVKVLKEEGVIVDFMLNTQHRLDKETATHYYRLTKKYALEHNIPLLKAVALMWQESTFYANSTSHVGAMGLLQIMPGTGKYYVDDLSTLYEPEVNVKVGLTYLAYLRDYYDRDLDTAILAYNQGMGNVDRGTYRTWYLEEVTEKCEKLEKIMEESLEN